MEGWVVFATVVTAFAGLAAAGAAIVLAWQNRRLVQASQDQVRASQEQVHVSQEQLESQQRPVLVPMGKPIFNPERDNWLKWNEETQPLSIRNVGTGTAFNVASVLYGCASYIHDLTGAQRSSPTGDPHWSSWLGVPIAPGEEVETTHRLGHGTFQHGNNSIGAIPFKAPDEQPPLVLATHGVLWRIARVTITYHDITGRKYASIFDYVHDRGWHMEAILSRIDRDLHDMEGYARPVPAASPPVPGTGGDVFSASN